MAPTIDPKSAQIEIGQVLKTHLAENSQVFNYRSDLTFFLKEEKVLGKYAMFWELVTKIKPILDNIPERQVLNV